MSIAAASRARRGERFRHLVGAYEPLGWTVNGPDRERMIKRLARLTGLDENVIRAAS